MGFILEIGACRFIMDMLVWPFACHREKKRSWEVSAKHVNWRLYWCKQLVASAFVEHPKRLVKEIRGKILIWCLHVGSCSSALVMMLSEEVCSAPCVDRGGEDERLAPCIATWTVDLLLLSLLMGSYYVSWVHSTNFCINWYMHVLYSCVNWQM